MNRKHTHKLVRLLIIALAFILNACVTSNGQSQVSTLVAATPALSSDVLAPSPSIVFVTRIPSPSFTPIFTATATPKKPTKPIPSATSTPSLPAYYKPHPALLRLPFLDVNRPCCDAETWRLIDEATHAISTATITNETDLAVTPANHLTFIKPEKPKLRSVFIHENRIVVMPEIGKEVSATLTLNDGELGQVTHMDRDLFGESLIHGMFGYLPVSNRYWIVYGFCYGGNSITGLHVIDAQKSVLYTIAERYAGNCEGGSAFGISPDGTHLIYNTLVVTLMNGELARICAGDESARSHVWSLDGRYVYVACGKDNLPDQLYRYDTQTNKELLLTDRQHIAFKALQMYLAPDQTRIVFVWKDNDYITRENYGMWMLDLARLDK